MKELTHNLEALYNSLPIEIAENNNCVKELYEMWLTGQDSDKVSAILHTNYHAVEKLNTALNIKW